MATLLPVLIFGVILAYVVEQTTVGDFRKNTQTSVNAFCFLLLVIVLAMPVGLRKFYNDTGAYITHFNNADNIVELLKEGNLSLFGNPAFNIFTSLVRTFTDNYHIYFLIHAFFVQWAFAYTIRRYSKHFALGIGLYICLGTYVFSFAAMKQILAMAILMLAVPYLLEKKYFKFFILVAAAFLFHTYAAAFAVLPLFTARPWKMRTFILLAASIFVISNFEFALSWVIDTSGEIGKDISEYEVFANAQVNTFRVAVYGVIPALSLLFKKSVFKDGEDDRQFNLLIHMSIISFAVMLLGTVSGANMFARMAQYFEFGIICGLGWLLERTFEERSAKAVTTIAAICFFAYFSYANMIALDFNSGYGAVTLFEFLQSLIE